jgi:hypothetical protein
MNELLYSCSESLPQPATPCPGDYGERVVTVILAKSLLWSGVPTPTEISEAWTAGTVSIFTNIVNGHRVFLGEQEIEVIHKEFKDKEYRIEGRTRRLDEATSRAFEKLDRYPVLYVWFITEKNWCFGGYECSTNFSLRIIEGKGVPPYVAFHFDYIDLGIDLAAYDANYADVPQSPSITVDSTTITVDSTIITVDSL